MTVIVFGGAEGNRTPGLNIANVALSQLSYSPNCFCCSMANIICTKYKVNSKFKSKKSLKTDKNHMLFRFNYLIFSRVL